MVLKNSFSLGSAFDEFSMTLHQDFRLIIDYISITIYIYTCTCLSIYLHLYQHMSIYVNTYVSVYIYRSIASLGR